LIEQSQLIFEKLLNFLGKFVLFLLLPNLKMMRFGIPKKDTLNTLSRLYSATKGVPGNITVQVRKETPYNFPPRNFLKKSKEKKLQRIAAMKEAPLIEYPYLSAQYLENKCLEILGDKKLGAMELEAKIFHCVWILSTHYYEEYLKQVQQQDKCTTNEENAYWRTVYDVVKRITPPIRGKAFKWMLKLPLTSNVAVLTLLETRLQLKSKINAKLIDPIVEKYQKENNVSALLSLLNLIYQYPIEPVDAHLSSYLQIVQSKRDVVAFVKLLSDCKLIIHYPIMVKLIEIIKNNDYKDIEQSIFTNLNEFVFPRESHFYMGLMRKYSNDFEILKTLYCAAERNQLFIPLDDLKLLDEFKEHEKHIETLKEIYSTKNQLYWFLENGDEKVALSYFQRLLKFERNEIDEPLIHTLIQAYLSKLDYDGVLYFVEQLRSFNFEVNAKLYNQMVETFQEDYLGLRELAKDLLGASKQNPDLCKEMIPSIVLLLGTVHSKYEDCKYLCFSSNIQPSKELYHSLLLAMKTCRIKDVKEYQSVFNAMIQGKEDVQPDSHTANMILGALEYEEQSKFHEFLSQNYPQICLNK
jgi:calcineurin-like phosphoesterase family protein